MSKKTVAMAVFAVFLSSVMMSACSLLPQSEKPETSPETETTKMNPSEKSGDTTKTGTVAENEGRFYLQGSGPAPQEIDSYTVDLKSYVGQTVTVTGQYSGDTLFVGSIK